MSPHGPPLYLSEENLTKAVGNALGCKNVKLFNLTFAPSTENWESFTSEIYRVQLTYKTTTGKSGELHLITKALMKSLHKSPQSFTKIIFEINVFETERRMFYYVIPKMHTLLGEAVGPRCFHPFPEHQAFIMEDLKTLGYVPGNRSVGLDEKHSVIVLRKLGKFHAASMVIAKSDPQLAGQFDKGFYNEFLKNSIIETFVMIPNLHCMANLVSSWPGYESIATKLRNIASNIYDLTLECVKFKAEDLNVINHGDFSVKNLLFKYDNNNTVTDVQFVDYQFSYYGSLGLDINFFIASSVQIEVIKTKEELLWRIYYDSLKETLEKLNFSAIPTWSEIRKEILKKKLLAFATIVETLPMLSVDFSEIRKSGKDPSKKVDEVYRDRDKMFTTPRMQSTLKFFLKYFDDNSFLDIQ